MVGAKDLPQSPYRGWVVLVAPEPNNTPGADEFEVVSAAPQVAPAQAHYSGAQFACDMVGPCSIVLRAAAAHAAELNW